MNSEGTMEKIKEKNILSKITEIYIIVMVMIFPLCVDSTGFFRILEAKYSYFLIINAIYIYMSGCRQKSKTLEGNYLPFMNGQKIKILKYI